MCSLVYKPVYNRCYQALLYHIFMAVVNPQIDIWYFFAILVVQETWHFGSATPINPDGTFHTS